MGRLVEEIKYQRDDYGNYQVAALTKLEYDAWGNIIEIIDPNGYTTEYQYDAMGRNSAIIFPAETGANRERTMDFDYSQNILTIATDDEYWEYQYDLLDRLIKVKENGITVAEYAYNHRGLRVRREDYKATGYYIFNLNL